MEQVILTFGMVAVVVVDTDSRFRSTFEAMCKLLKLIFWPLSRGNHKGNSVERYHRFLNKTQTISGQVEERMRCSIRILKYHSMHRIARQLTTQISHAM